MALKGTLDSLEGLPEVLHEHYAKDETTGKFTLVAEGFVPKAKLDEFRNNNIKFLREKEEAEAKLAGIDIEEYQALKEEKRKQKDKKMIEEGQVDELVNSRVTEMKTKYEADVEAASKKAASLQSKLEVVLIDSELAKAAAEAGVNETAVDDVIRRGRDTFRLVDEKVVPIKDGQTVYGADGVTPLGIKEWLSKLAVSAPHLFKPSKGGGADGGNGKGSGNTGVTKKSQLKNAAEKAKFIGEHGRIAYLSLPD